MARRQRKSTTPARARGTTTIRTRMSLSMLASAALLIPVVLLSLFYIRRMNDAVGRIVDEDIELIHIAGRITLDFTQARRDEKNFLLYRDSIHISQTHAALARIDSMAERGRQLEPDLSDEFDDIVALTTIYQALSDSLIRLPAPDRPARIDIPSLSHLRRIHENLLRAATETGDSTRRDSVLAEAARLAANVSIRQFGSRALNDSIRTIQREIGMRTDTIGAHARRQVVLNRRRARHLAAWGQRNIITVLLLVIVLLVWLVIALPRQAVFPIKRITNALRRTEDGELDVHINLRTRDELGQLAWQLNRSFARLRVFDERKVNHILQLEKRFRLLANDITEGVLVVDTKPNVVMANAAIEGLLGCPAAEAQGKGLDTYPRLKCIIESLERALAGATSRQTCNILPELSGSVVCIEILRNKAGEITGALVIISHPQRPDGKESATVVAPD